MWIKKRSNIIKLCIILSILSLIALYIFYIPVQSVVNIIFIAFIIAYTVKPMKDYLSEKLRISKKKSSLLIIVSAIIVFLGLMYFIIPIIIDESSHIGDTLQNIEEYIKKIVIRIDAKDIPLIETIYAQLSDRVNIFIEEIVSNLGISLIRIMENIINLAIVPIIAYYLLVDGDIIYNKIMLVFPTEKRVVIKKIISNIDRVLGRYIMSQLLLSIIIGILTLILLVVIRVRFPVALAIINAITNIIPYFGPILGGIPIVFIALTISPTKGLIAFIGVILIQQIEGNILAPTITGDSTNMHPIIIIILLILGEKIGGIIGMIVVVPIAVMIKVIYDDINNYLF